MQKLEIYIRNKKKPIVVIGKNLLDALYTDLRTCDIIKFGPIIFRREDFIYAVEEKA